MTFEDMRVVEAHVADLRAGAEPKLPVMLSKTYDRVDIDARKLDSQAACALVDLLSQELGRKGYLWDVWMDLGRRPWEQIIHVAERGKDPED